MLLRLRAAEFDVRSRNRLEVSPRPLGSKFKAVNHRDRNFTSGKLATRMALIEYLCQIRSTRDFRSKPLPNLRAAPKLIQIQKFEAFKAALDGGETPPKRLTKPPYLGE